MLVSGDCTIIRTRSGKNILVDTGEKENVLLEYLLDREITRIDYLMISHFDSDHSSNAKEVLENLKVKNIIISRQAEETNEFEEILKIVNRKQVNVIEVQAGDIVYIDQNTYFRILWPDTNNIIDKNALNNNSIVAKLCYKNFSMLFTGDIEEVAEKEIIRKYSEEELKSTILKVAHHGSATSTEEEFLIKVSPRISLIGVGKDNNFGHPAEKVIKLLNTYGIKIYRTDMDGEISIIVNRKGGVKINAHV